MPNDPSSHSGTPRRHRPSLSELSKETTEEALWDLEDDDLGAAETPAVEPRSPEKKPSSAPKEPEAPAPEPVAASEPPTEELTAPTNRKQNEAETSPAGPDPEVTQAAPNKPEPQAKPSRKTSAPLSIGDKKQFAIIGIILAVLAAGLLITIFSSVDKTKLGADDPDLPATGEYITVESIETFWRKPNQGSDQSETVRRSVISIPVSELEISGEGNGVIRAVYRNDEGDFVGDSITRSFTAGRFDDNQSTKITFPATSGFTEHGEFNAYRVGATRWTVEFLEGPNRNAAGSQFRSLLKTDISSFQR